MTISVIIPAYRAAGTIARAVQSVLDQTLAPKEIVVVDDGSPDNLASALSRFDGRVQLIRQRNGGPSSARNLGIERSTGELIAFLDADDYWEPTKLQRQCAVLRQHPEVGLVAGKFFSQAPGELRRSPLDDSAELHDRVLHGGTDDLVETAQRVWTSTVLLRRSALAAMRFECGMNMGEDCDLWIRIAADHPVYLLSDPLATAVLEPGSLSRSNLDEDCLSMLRLVRRHANLVGPRSAYRWETWVYRRWAGALLAGGNARAALRPALKRLARQVWSIEGWWILAKCAGKSLRRNPYQYTNA